MITRYRDNEQLYFIILKSMSYFEDRYIPSWIIHQIISGFRPSLFDKLELLTNAGILDKMSKQSLRMHKHPINYYRITAKGKYLLFKLEALMELIPPQFKPSSLSKEIEDARTILKQLNHRPELLATTDGVTK